MKVENARSGELEAVDSHIMNVVNAHKRNNPHLDHPYRIFLINIIVIKITVMASMA